MDDNVIGEVGFKFNARFSQLIGRNLISNPIVAVSELVKNAYDADADNINVKFENLTNGTSSIKISDDGEGMSFQDLTTKWMMIGTDNKIHTPFSNKGRRKLGEKGIGRFSVERLANCVIITTTKENQNFSISLSINWDQYENFSGEFSDLKHKIISTPCKSETHGTTIILSGLRDEWTKDRIKDLQKEMELLRPIDINKISYNKYKFAGDNVRINVEALEYFKTAKFIDSHFVQYAQAHLYGEIDSRGIVNIKVRIKSNISASKNEIFESFTYNEKNQDVDTSCGPVKYEVFIFLKDQRLYKSLSVEKKGVDEYLNTFSGVKIYRDGFRILPFGDIDDDWLELNAQRTRSPEFRVSTQNTIGVVYITRDDNEGLQDVLSRENMYETKEFDALKKFVNLAFEKYTFIQLRERKKKYNKAREEGKVALEDAQLTLNKFTKQLDEVKEVVSKTKSANTAEEKLENIANVEGAVNNMVSDAVASLETMKKAYKFYKKQSNFESREIQIYRNIATLGISAAMFGHEALNQTVDAKAILIKMDNKYRNVLEGIIELKELFDDLRQDLILIDEKADFFRNYLQKEKQDKSSYINVAHVLSNLLNQHKEAFKAINVFPKVELKSDIEELVTWGYEGDFDTIFANLITNSYKALKKEEGDKFFEFVISIMDYKIIINVRNNGKEIPNEHRENIFQPLFSTYSDGTGLGLTIIQDTIKSYQGEIKLGSGFPITEFILTIPIGRKPEEVA